MQSLSHRPHPVLNEVWIEDDDPYFAHKINMPGLHAFRVDVGEGWYVIRYYRRWLDRQGRTRFDAWDGGTYPAHWFQPDWSQFAWAPFGKAEQRPRRLHLVK